MSAPAPDILVLCGSPHEGGASEQVSEGLRAHLRECGASTTLWRLSEHPVAACRDCGGCAVSGECVVADAWHVLSRHMDACDALVVVAPVYFAGPSAHLKAALDRCQTYWTRKYRLHMPLPAVRRAHLVVLGEGGDPFDTSALETICTSALNCANLRIEDRVKRFVGCGAPADAELARLARDIAAGASGVACAAYGERFGAPGAGSAGAAGASGGAGDGAATGISR